MRVLPIASRVRAKMGTGEDLRARARCGALPRAGRKLLGKAPNGSGNWSSLRERHLEDSYDPWDKFASLGESEESEGGRHSWRSPSTQRERRKATQSRQRVP